MKFEYEIIIEETEDLDLFNVYVSNLPGCETTGTHYAQALRNGIIALKRQINLLKEQGWHVYYEDFDIVIKLKDTEGNILFSPEEDEEEELAAPKSEESNVHKLT